MVLASAFLVEEHSLWQRWWFFFARLEPVAVRYVVLLPLVPVERPI